MTPSVGLAHWVAQRASRSPERKALHFEGRTWTYAEMQREIEAAAARLAALGVARGDRVAFLGRDQPMFFFTMYPTARLGGVFVPLNFRLTGPELAFMLNDSGSVALIVDGHLMPTIAPVRSELTGLRAFLSAEDAANWTPEPPPAPAAEVAADDIAMIMHTSGTTGRPKGAMLTHGNFW